MDNYEKFIVLDHYNCSHSGSARFLFGLYCGRKAAERERHFSNRLFLPVATSVAVVAIVWGKMLQPYQGIITHYLSEIGLKGQMNILGMPKSAILDAL